MIGRQLFQTLQITHRNLILQQSKTSFQQLLSTKFKPGTFHQFRQASTNHAPPTGVNALRNAFHSHPYASNIVAAFVLWTLGDVLCQVAENVNEIHSDHDHSHPVEHPADVAHRSTFFNPFTHYDFPRTFRMATYGLFVGGPLYCWWYQHLTRLVPPFRAANPRIALLKMALVKTVLDQFVFCPPELAFFFSLTTLMEGGWIREIKQRLSQDFVATFYVDIIVWVPLQLINFMFIPPSFQAVFVHTGNLGWNAYLRYFILFYFRIFQLY